MSSEIKYIQLLFYCIQKDREKERGKKTFEMLKNYMFFFEDYIIFVQLESLVVLEAEKLVIFQFVTFCLVS
jgi:hypothetical protein